MENEIVSSTQEVDAEGGWLVTHWTKTWDTRVPLTQLADQLAAAEAEAAAAQEKVATIKAQQVTFKNEVEAAQAAQALELETKTMNVESATSTPKQ